MAEWQNGRTAELRRMVRCKTHGTRSRWSWRVKVLGRQNAQQERQSRGERASEQERGDGKRQNAVWTGSDRTGVRSVAHERSTTSEEQHVAVRALLLFSETENENGATGACLSVCPSVRLSVCLWIWCAPAFRIIRKMRGAERCLLILSVATLSLSADAVSSRLPRTSAGQLAAAAAAQNKTVYQLRNTNGVGGSATMPPANGTTNKTLHSTVGPPPGRGASNRVRCVPHSFLNSQ